MPKVVIRNLDQLKRYFSECKEDLAKFGALDMTRQKHVLPRTKKQQGQFNAMVTDIARFTFNDDVIGDLKKTDFWPKEETRHTGFYEDGTTYIYTSMDPKSQNDLSREEQSFFIDLLFLMGDKLGPTFHWTDPGDRDCA